ncbi:trypsin-like serine protease [Verrucomicrobiaceae bacterium 227]
MLIVKVSGVTLRHGLPDGAGVALGERIDFAEVVQVTVGAAGGGGVSGSGVMLNSEWVLSAGHLGNAAVAGDVTVEVGGVRHQVSEVVEHPGWLDEPVAGLSQRQDLVLFRLSEPVSAAPAVPIWQGGGSGAMISLMAGFGNGGNGLLGAYAGAGVLQAGMNVVDRSLMDGGGGFWVTDFDSGQVRHNSLNQETVDFRYFDIDGGDPTLSETVFTVLGNESQAGFEDLPTAADFFPGMGDFFPEGTTARGDSGGPLFVYSDERARWELAGVTSFGVNPLFPAGFNRFDSRYGDLSFFTDVRSQEEWLNTVMVPEPSRQISIASFLIFVCWRRFR